MAKNVNNKVSSHLSIYRQFLIIKTPKHQTFFYILHFQARHCTLYALRYSKSSKDIFVYSNVCKSINVLIEFITACKHSAPNSRTRHFK